MLHTHISVERALKLLLAFIPHNQERGTVELSKSLGLHPSTVSRLLCVLTKYGFLQQDAITKRYKLGEAAASIGNAITHSFREGLVAIAKPHIDALRDRIRDTVSLELMEGDGTVVAYRAKGPHIIQVLFSPGERLPIHMAAGAKTILAFSSPETVNRLLRRELQRFTPNTITDLKILKAQLYTAS